MIVLGILVLAGLGLVALSGRRAATAAQQTIQTAIDNTARGIDPARGGGPPGLLLRREPEIRAMTPEVLADYIRVTKNWLMAGNMPTEAWWDSFISAQAEVLLRTRSASRDPARTSDLDDRQLMALYAWISKLRDLGMPLNSDEEALRVNLLEELEWRRAHPDQARPSADPYAEIRANIERLRAEEASLQHSALSSQPGGTP